MPPFARAGMAGVQVAVVLHLERIRVQRGIELALDVVRGDAGVSRHDFGSFAAGSGSR